MSEEPMRDDLPTEERLDRIERAVLSRIRLEEDARIRRRRRLAGGGVGLALAAAVVGLVVVGHPAGQVDSGSAGGSAYSEPSSAAGGDRAASGGRAATIVLCHAGDSTGAPSATAAVPDLTPARIAAACAAALGPEAAPRPSSTPTTAGISGPVLCRDDRGRLQVFLTDRPAKTVCTANAMQQR